MKGDSISIIDKYNSTFYLVCDANFEVPEMARKIYLSKISYKAKFGIETYTPKNIEIICLDSTEILFDAFKKSTIANINKLEFIQDTSAYSIILHYNFVRDITNDYVDYSKQGIINAYFKSYSCPIIENLSKRKEFKIDYKTNSVTFYARIETDKIVKIKPEILVERIFSQEKDSVLIIQNNLPYFKNEVIRIAKSYRQDYIKEKIGLEKKEIKPTRFFIKFDVVTIPKICVCN